MFYSCTHIATVGVKGLINIAPVKRLQDKSDARESRSLHDMCKRVVSQVKGFERWQQRVALQ